VLWTSGRAAKWPFIPEVAIRSLDGSGWILDQGAAGILVGAVGAAHIPLCKALPSSKEGSMNDKIAQPVVGPRPVR